MDGRRREVECPPDGTELSPMAAIDAVVVGVRERLRSHTPCIMTEEDYHNYRPPTKQDMTERRDYYSSLLSIHNAGSTVTHTEGRVIVWIDGSRRTIAGCSQAGAGVFYGYGNPDNCALAVTGDQSSERAELTALLHVLRTATDPLLVITDSLYMQKGITGWPLDNEDMWEEVRGIIKSRGSQHIRTSAGLTTDFDVWGNINADALAAEAAGNTKLNGFSHVSVPCPVVDVSDESMCLADALNVYNTSYELPTEDLTGEETTLLNFIFCASFRKNMLLTQTRHPPVETDDGGILV
eukprot:gene57281-biopygen80950